jgi:hypothetical protein
MEDIEEPQLTHNSQSINLENQPIIMSVAAEMEEFK